jgi:hypothetical protein
MTWRRENSGPYDYSNSNPLVVQAVPSRYTDYATQFSPIYYTLSEMNFAFTILNVLSHEEQVGIQHPASMKD